MAAASAVLEVLVGPAKGRHEFKRVPDPYDRSLNRFTVDCYDVDFDHQGRCELRCEGDEHVLTKDQYVLWLPRATIDLLGTQDPFVDMGKIRFAVTKPIDSRDEPDRFAQLERRVRLLEMMTTGDGFVSFQDLRSREGTPLADPNPNFNGIPIPRGALWFVALFDHDDELQTNPLGGKFFYNAIEKDRFTVGLNVFVKEL